MDVTAKQPSEAVLYQFTPNIDFNHKDDLGNIVSGYEKGMTCTVRAGNTKLHAVVQGWMKKPAHDEKDKPILVGGEPLMLVRMGQ